jgi:hypothetical protein
MLGALLAALGWLLVVISGNLSRREARYWIQHQIGSARNACPWLSVSGRWVEASDGWHPIDN